MVAQPGTKALEHPDRVTGELSGLMVDQFLQDLEALEWIIKSLPHNGQAQSDTLSARYQMAPPPPKDHRASMWYRVRLLTLDWSENFKGLALYLSWRGDRMVVFAGPSRARSLFHCTETYGHTLRF